MMIVYRLLNNCRTRNKIYCALDNQKGIYRGRFTIIRVRDVYRDVRISMISGVKIYSIRSRLHRGDGKHKAYKAAYGQAKNGCDIKIARGHLRYNKV